MADTKRMGTLFEHLFITECLRRRLTPHVPVGDYQPHDSLVLSETGAAFRVQVKGTATVTSRDGKTRFRVNTKQGGTRNRSKVNCSLVEIIAAYVAPMDIWYVVPCEKVTGYGMWLYPQILGHKGRYEKYKNNWDAFND